MAIRITQSMMYSDMVGQMQKNLAAYMESNEQGSTQKKINRPSDDPAGAYRVLTTRDDLNATAQYQTNVDTARGWLELADSVLSTRVSTLFQDLESLAQQASNTEMSAETANRSVSGSSRFSVSFSICPTRNLKARASSPDTNTTRTPLSRAWP